MADIVTNMKVNSSGYEQGLKKAQESQRRFAKGAKDAGKEVGTLGSAFGKFQGSVSSVLGTLGKTTGILAGVAGGFDILKGAIHGSQATSDAFDQAMAACKVTVNNFFSAIATGDFSAFNAGLGNMISLAVQAQQALDQLGNTAMAMNIVSAQVQAQMAGLREIISDPDASKGEKKKALADMDTLLKKQEEGVSLYIKDTEDYLRTSVASMAGVSADYIKMSDVEYALALDASKGRAQAKNLSKKYAEEFADIAAGRPQYLGTGTAGGGVYGKTMTQEQIDKEIKAFLNNPEKVRGLVTWKMLGIMDDESLGISGQKYMAAKTKQTEMETTRRQYNKQVKQFNQSLNDVGNAFGAIANVTGDIAQGSKAAKAKYGAVGKTGAAGRAGKGGTVKPEDLLPKVMEGSEEFYDNAIAQYSAIKKRYAIGSKEYKEWEAKELEMIARKNEALGIREAIVEQGSLTYMEDLVSNLTKQRDMLVDGSDEWVKINSELEEAQKNLDAYNAKQNEAKTLADITDIMNAGNAEVNMLPEPKRLFTDEQQAQVKGYTEQINNLSTAYKALFDIMNDGEPKTQEVMDTLKTNMEEINTNLQSSKDALNQLFATGEQQQKDNEMLAEKRQHWSDIASVVNGVGSVFTATGNKSAKAIGTIIGQMGGLIGTYADLIGKSAAATVAGSGKGLVFPYNIIAITATLAAVMSAVSAAQSLAYGGIVGGSDFRDGISARVSSGEMVMNEADQRRLYDAIHTGNFGGGGGNSYVSGEQIVTVVNAWGRRTGRGEIIR